VLFGPISIHNEQRDILVKVKEPELNFVPVLEVDIIFMPMTAHVSFDVLFSSDGLFHYSFDIAMHITVLKRVFREKLEHVKQKRLVTRLLFWVSSRYNLIQFLCCILDRNTRNSSSKSWVFFLGLNTSIYNLFHKLLLVDQIVKMALKAKDFGR
jgi:hypothetical protein